MWNHPIFGCDSSVCKNSDLQAGIWFGTMALSPIMTLPRLHYCLVVFDFNLVFYTHMRMRNTAYISFHHVEFYLRLRQLMTFPVWGQLYWDCQGEESSTIISGNMRFTLQCDFFWGNLNFWGHLHFWSRLNFWGRLNFLGRLHLWGRLHFWGHLQFWGCHLNLLEE